MSSLPEDSSSYDPFALSQSSPEADDPLKSYQINTLLVSGLGELADIVEYMKMAQVGPHNYYQHHTLIYGSLCTARDKVDEAWPLYVFQNPLEESSNFSFIKTSLQNILHRLNDIEAGRITTSDAALALKAVEEIRYQLTHFLAKRKGFVLLDKADFRKDEE